MTMTKAEAEEILRAEKLIPPKYVLNPFIVTAGWLTICQAALDALDAAGPLRTDGHMEFDTEAEAERWTSGRGSTRHDAIERGRRLLRAAGALTEVQT